LGQIIASWDHAQQFSWRESMQALFGELSPRAMTAAARRSRSVRPVRAPLVEA
jgi:hypothetical protein